MDKEILERLQKYAPLAIVVRLKDGNVEALVEHSFSVDWSDTHVRVFWSGKAYSILGEHLINGIDDATHNAKEGQFACDALSDDCPIEIDWEKWLSAFEGNGSKFDARNAPYTTKAVIS